MADDCNLAGVKVLVTRPEPQASRLSQFVQESGGIAYNCPMIDIIPVQPTLPPLSWKGYDWLIFVSANAVRFALETGMQPMSDVQIAAIGPATASALKKAGFRVSCQAPAPHTSESLLLAPALHRVAGQKVLIVRGQGGRGHLYETLTNRGAEVAFTEVYRRVFPQKPVVEKLKQALLQNISVVTVTSGEILKNLTKSANEMLGRLLQLPVIVVSERLARQARSEGFTYIITAESASNEAILRAIQQWRLATAES